MRVYLHPSKNEYLRTEDGIWVRNLCKPNVVPLNINDLETVADKRLFLENETKNLRRGRVYLDPNLRMQKVVIVSDGHGFEKQQEVLASLPQDTSIIAVNGALSKWRLMDKSRTARRQVAFYFLNNPYRQCLKWLPRHGYFPKCIVSSRANAEFVEGYQGDVMFYTPADEENFTGRWSGSESVLDDYRNPVCGAISFAYRCRAKRIVLFCCDESYDTERPGSTKLENGLWSYPQQIMGQRIVGEMLGWVRRNTQIKVGDCSSGAKNPHAEYINTEDLPAFLNDEEH